MILLVAVAGIFALAAMAVALSPRSPSPTAPAIGIASSTPAPPPIDPSTAPTSPIDRSTARPTDPPPWAWTRADLLPHVEFEPLGMWTVNGRVLVLARHPASAEGGRASWSIARSASGREWDLAAAPAAIDELLGGSVVDEEVWFLARVGGVTSESTTWELVSTTTGQDWSSIGESQLGPVDGVVFIGRVAGRWVAAPWRYGGGEGEGAIEMDLLWSDDGLEWHPADLPEMQGKPTFSRMALLDGAMVILGAEHLRDRETPFVIHSTDGIAWLESHQAVPQVQAPTGFACGPLACTIVTTPTDDLVGAPMALVSRDLREWVAADIFAPARETGGHLTNLSVTDAGFLAMGTGTGYAFVSVDGLTWASRQVIAAPGGMEPFLGIAVTGNGVVALIRGPSNGSPSVWTGLLPPIDS